MGNKIETIQSRINHCDQQIALARQSMQKGGWTEREDLSIQIWELDWLTERERLIEDLVASTEQVG